MGPRVLAEDLNGLWFLIKKLIFYLFIDMIITDDYYDGRHNY